MPTSVKTLLNSKKIKSVISVNPDTMVYDALVIMNEAKIGALLIMVDDKLVGIFSERDYARKGIVQGRKAKSTPISDLMTPNVFTITSSMTTKDCLELMSEKHIRHLPVVDDGKVSGILSVGDIVTEMINEQKQHIQFLESYIQRG